MKLSEALKQLDEVVDDKEIASEITKLLGLVRIQVQKVERNKALDSTYVDGWIDAEKRFNLVAKKEFKGVKAFK